MKKLYLSLATLIIFNCLSAQNKVSSGFTSNPSLRQGRTMEGSVKINGLPVSKFSSAVNIDGTLFKQQSPVDTAGIEFMQDAIIGYKVIDAQSGYEFPLFGINFVYDEAFAQGYEYWGSGLNIEQVLILFSQKNIVTDKPIDVNIYSTTDGSPSSIIATKTINASSVDTGGAFTVVNFDTPVNVTSHFAAGIDITQLYIEAGGAYSSVGIISTAQGQPHGSDRARIFVWPDRVWKPVNDVWGSGAIPGFDNGISNVNLIILPVVSGTYTSIEEAEMMNGIKMCAIYPNPSKDEAKIEYQLADESTVIIDIIDATGKKVMSFDEGKKTVGIHEVMVNISKLAPGNYFYSLSAGENRQTRKLVIE